MNADHPPATSDDLIKGLLELWDQSNQKNIERNRRLDELEQRLATVEARKSEPAVCWRGIHEHGKRYEAGALITRDGSLWLAVDATTEQPGKSSSWRLIVKGDRR